MSPCVELVELLACACAYAAAGAAELALVECARDWSTEPSLAYLLRVNVHPYGCHLREGWPVSCYPGSLIPFLAAAVLSRIGIGLAMP